MYPPFHPFDLRIDASGFDPFEEKRVIRRGPPEALRLVPPPPGAPFALYVATRPPDPVSQRSGPGFWRLVRHLRFAPQV